MIVIAIRAECPRSSGGSREQALCGDAAARCGWHDTHGGLLAFWGDHRGELGFKGEGFWDEREGRSEWNRGKCCEMVVVFWWNRANYIRIHPRTVKGGQGRGMETVFRYLGKVFVFQSVDRRVGAGGMERRYILCCTSRNINSSIFFNFLGVK